MRRVLAMVLAGGSTRELTVLTGMRAATAMPFGGKYRVIDFTLSNLCNSDLYQVAILTQHAPLSLHAHVGIGKPWDLDRRDGGIFLLQPYQKQSETRWYLGTADAVRQNLDVIRNLKARQVLLLPGDLVYKMDYSWLLRAHQESQARVTLAVGPVEPSEARRFGMCEVDAEGRIRDFREKPLESTGGLAFLGVACFDVDFLEAELAARPDAYNLVTEIIQPIVARGERVDAYRFEGYWEDVGTIDSYYRASMDLLTENPRLNLYDPEWIIYTRSEELPPAKFLATARTDRSLLASGCVVGGTVERSILFPGVWVEEGAVVRDSILFNDVRVAAGAVVERVIADKSVVVGPEALVGDGEEAPHGEAPELLQGGLTIVGRDAILPAGIVIGRHCVIEPDVGAADFDGLSVPAGRTIRRRGEGA